MMSCGDDPAPVGPPNPGGNDPDPDPPAPRTLTIPSTGATSPEAYDGMELVWSDEFDADAVNTDDWTFQLGNGNNGWGNNEAQFYKEENTSLVDGHLVIEAVREELGSWPYSSSRLITQGKQEFQYGRIDIRAAMPDGSGVWPALWMLGVDFPAVGWPKCGEIDIMENFGAEGNQKVRGTVHWDNAGDYANFGGSQTLTSGNIVDEFHVYSIDWNENEIVWYIDDTRYHAIDITGEDLSEFRQPFFFIVNLAIGGDKGAGDPGPNIYPQWMILDYIRVFQ